MIRIVPATAEMVRVYRGEDMPRSARVLAAVDDDRVLGIGGIYPDTARQVAFMDISDELRAHPRVLIRASRLVMQWVRDAKMPTHALCDEEIKRAAEFLEYLGFRRLYRGVFAWQK